MKEVQMMDMSVPVNLLATAIVQLLPLAEEWLRKQIGGLSANDSSVPVPLVREWLSPEDAAIEINRTTNHVRELCRKGRFGTKDAGGKWIIHRKELEAFRLGRTKIHGERFP